MTSEREIKPVFVSRHALARVRQRNIDLLLVKAALRTPDLKVLGARGRLKAIRSFHGRELVVVYVETRRVLVLVTAYWR